MSKAEMVRGRGRAYWTRVVAQSPVAETVRGSWRFQKGGMVLWHKRLDCGRFQIHFPDAGARAELDPTQLAMLVDGIDFGRVKRPHHWQPKREQETRMGIDRAKRS